LTAGKSLLTIQGKNYTEKTVRHREYLGLHADESARGAIIVFFPVRITVHQQENNNRPESSSRAVLRSFTIRGNAMGTQPEKPEPRSSVVFLQGRRVILRPLRKSTDLETCLRWINDPEVNQFLAAYLPVSETQEAEWFDNLAKRPNDIVFGIELRENGRFIGVMGLHRINWKDRVATTGAIIGEKDCWGKGYGTDAKMILLDYAFNTLNLRKVCSSVIAFNRRSLRYSLHCGYRREGRLRRQMFRRGRYWDEILLGLFREDWLPIWEKYQKTGKV